MARGVVRVTATWRSTQMVEPPDDMAVEEFQEALADGSDLAWTYALQQVDASTAELVDWEVE